MDEQATLSETLAKKDYLFCVGFNTSAIYEALLYQRNVLQYLCGNDEFIIPEISSIKNLATLPDEKPKKAISRDRLSYYFDSAGP